LTFGQSPSFTGSFVGSSLISHDSGNHETPGTWRHGGLEGDVLDLQIVVDYLKKNYGYEIDLLAGHSRGAIVAFHWLCTAKEGKDVGGFVNVSGRYRMRVSGHASTQSLFRLDLKFYHLCRKYTVEWLSNFIPMYPDISSSDTPAAQAWKPVLDSQGYYEWNAVVARKPVVGIIYPNDLEDFANWDTSIVWDKFPSSTDVLTVHGLADQTVSP
jgi:pimeloyl-ACP methyl ester carboxylesterase